MPIDSIAMHEMEITVASTIMAELVMDASLKKRDVKASVT